MRVPHVLELWEREVKNEQGVGICSSLQDQISPSIAGAAQSGTESNFEVGFYISDYQDLETTNP